MAEQTPATNGAAEPQRQLALQKIYVRDASFEVPNAPAVFREEGQPQVQLNLSHKATPVADGNFEVMLTLTVPCSGAGRGSARSMRRWRPSAGGRRSSTSSSSSASVTR